MTDRVENAVMGGPLIREPSLLARIEALEARVSRLEGPTDAPPRDPRLPWPMLPPERESYEQRKRERRRGR